MQHIGDITRINGRGSCLMSYYIASCSFGKDSLAMILRLIEENKPLDEVVFFDRKPWCCP